MIVAKTETGIKIGFTILPHFKRVQAEIFKIVDIDNGKFHIHLLSKSFKRPFKNIDETDYEKARDWVDTQIKSIVKSNKLTLK